MDNFWRNPKLSSLTPDVNNKIFKLTNLIYSFRGPVIFSKGICLDIFARNIVPYNSANSFDIIAGLSFALPDQRLKLTE